MASTGDGPATEPGRVGEITTGVLVAVVFLSTIVVAAVVGLTLAGKPVDNVLYIFAALLVPTVTQLLQSRKIDKNTRHLQEVRTKVNGRLDGLLKERAQLEEQVRSLGGTPVTSPVPKQRQINKTSPYGYPPQIKNGGKHRG